MPHLRAEPRARAATASAASNASACWARRSGAAGRRRRRGATRCRRPRARRRPAPASACGDAGRPSRPRWRTAAGQPGVDLQVHPGGAAGRPGGGGDLVQRPGRVGRQVDVGGDRLREVRRRARAARTARGALIAGRPQRERLGELGDAEPGRAAGDRGRARDGTRPCPYASALTTAITSARRRAPASARRRWPRMAPRSTSASAGSTGPRCGVVLTRASLSGRAIGARHRVERAAPASTGPPPLARRPGAAVHGGRHGAGRAAGPARRRAASRPPRRARRRSRPWPARAARRAGPTHGAAVGRDDQRGGRP